MDGLRLHVADLDSNATKRDIEETFGKYGPVMEIWMARSVPCFAFVVFKRKEDAYEACRGADGLDICGRRVRVTMARPRTRGQTGRRGFDPSMRCYQVTVHVYATEPVSYHRDGLKIGVLSRKIILK